MNRILDKHAPLKKLSKYELKFKTKPWITMALQKPIQSRTNYLVITLIKKIFLKKLNFTLNKKVAETCYLP